MASDIVKYDSQPLLPTAQALFKSGLFPNIRNEFGAYAVVQLGSELGLSPMTSLQVMAIIKGKITIMGQAMLTLAIRNGIKYVPMTVSKTACKIKFSRDGFGDMEVEFTLEDAKRAGLVKPESGYDKYPEEMLWWRCVAKGLRRIAPDVITGIYAREEIEGDDSIIDVTPTDKKDPTVKKFDPKNHKPDQTAPPINDGEKTLASSDAEPGVEGAEATPGPSVIDVQPEVVTEPVTGEAGDAAQELFNKLQVAIKEIETDGNKFRWKNWLKKHTKEINSLKEQDENSWTVILNYVAFMNNKKWK